MDFNVFITHIIPTCSSKIFCTENVSSFKLFQILVACVVAYFSFFGKQKCYLHLEVDIKFTKIACM